MLESLRTFGNTLAEITRLQGIDELHRDLHHHLGLEDTCYFFFEYTSGKDYTFSETNQLIKNLKKPPSRKEMPDYRYKRSAINHISALFSSALNAKWLREATLVPIPPSKKADHPEYDDRMSQICRGIRFEGHAPDVRELVTLSNSYPASSASGSNRISCDDLTRLYLIDETKSLPPPTMIGIVDDVLTAGTHYRAMHTVLSRRFPNATITGLFIARRVFPDDY